VVHAIDEHEVDVRVAKLPGRALRDSRRRSRRAALHRNVSGRPKDHCPTWSPDGRAIVFERDRSTNPAGRSRLMAVDVASRVERTV
jgi:dipeptidyl aminopeptidase/acylaminoacyl peptidase